MFKKITTLLLILAITAVVIVSVVRMTDNDPYQDRFSVSAVGKVYAKSDIANITLGIKTEAKKNPADAVSENSEKMNDIIKELKDLGIEAKDIKTTSYSLNPVYDWRESTGQRLRGYEVYQNVSVKIRELDKIGDVIAKVTEKGANQIGNVSFTIDDEYELKNAARELAIEKAKEKAKAIAKESGLKLGKVKNVMENKYYQPRAYDYANAKMELGIGAGGGGVEMPDIQVGENEVSVEVTVTYEVK